jgi:glycosyltransferase involved in cell wall biosynthesis
VVRPAEGERGGASRSRNVGAARARGDVLAFLDDDDRWAPAYLGRATAAIADDRVGFVVTWLAADRDGRITPHRSPARGLTAADAVVHNPGVTGSNLVVRRELFEAVGGFDPELWVSNDKDLLVRLLDHGAAYELVEDRLVLKRLHAGDRLSNATDRRRDGLERYLAKHDHRLTAAQRRELHARLVELRRLRARGTPRRAALAVRELALLGPAGMRTAYRRGELRIPRPRAVRAGLARAARRGR